MFAVIKTGGKQYKVQKDATIVVEKLEGNEGDTVSFDTVLAVNGQIGTPVVEGAVVAGKIIKQTRGEKIIVFKKIRRHGYKRKNGHKQYLTVVQITDIKG